ncbi:MAG: GNAT family N-acetyltransferase [Planctomycetes bacterium]|nr:GNAT family N-acetyltransferase [Planctomycetota bacterium]
MIEIRPMNEQYIHVRCLHGGPVDPAACQAEMAKDAQPLPPHPWSDETILAVTAGGARVSEGYSGRAGQEFMREMIRRYGTCAMLAWEDGRVVGQLRFYPLTIGHLLAKSRPKDLPGAPERFEADPTVLYVQCVMTSRPYFAGRGSGSLGLYPAQGGAPDLVAEADGTKRYRTAEESGARRGVGQKLVRALVEWARDHGWKRIVVHAHADIDFMYGEYGIGGKAFWEKAGFRVTRSHVDRPSDERWRTIVEAQAREKHMDLDEAWSWYEMECRL